LSLYLIQNAQRHVKAYKELLNLKFLQNQLVEVGHQIWQVAQLRHCYLQTYRLTLVINEFYNESLLRLSYPRTSVVGVHLLNLVHIELLYLIWDIFDVFWWIQVWLVPLYSFAKLAFEPQKSILNAFDDLLALNLKA